MKYYSFNHAIAVIFIWIGFVCAISFMEAWLKFQAPGITVEQGLSIGQLIFNALNKVEITCALFISISLIFSKNEKEITTISFLFVPLLILSIQTAWLLPALEVRAKAIISGIDPPKSKLHLWYVLLEAVKVLSLFIYGIKLLAMKRWRS